MPSDTGRDCQCITSSEEIIDENIIINLIFSGVPFSQIVTGRDEDLQFFRHLTVFCKCQYVNIDLLVTMRCKESIMKMLSCVKTIRVLSVLMKSSNFHRVVETLVKIHVG